MTFQQILSRLQNIRKNGTGYTAKCPAHKDEKNSLSLSEKSDKIILNCFAHCTVNEICTALDIKIKDLFFESNQQNKQIGEKHTYKSNAAKKIVAVYPYTDERGELLYENVRFEPKDFRQRHYDENGKEVWSLNGARRVPYRLPELIEAVKNGADVWLCEGEKDADNLRSLGLTASSFKNWKSEFNQYLKTAHVCLIQDHDKAGLKQATDALKLLSENVASLKMLDLFQNELLPEKHGKDFTYWFENEKQNGLSNDEITERLCIFADNADAWQLNEQEFTETIQEIESTEKLSKLSPLRTVKLSEVNAEEIIWLWKPFIAIGAFAIIEGAEGEGKTFITLAIATTTGIGKGFPMMSDEEHLEPANVVLMSAEDSLAHTIKPRLDAMNAPCESIIAIDEPFTLDRNGIIRLGMVLAEFAPKLVIIDPLFSYTGKVNLDRDNEIRSVTSELTRLAEKYECAIVGIRHIGKSKGMGDPRNAGLNGIGWRASARSVLLVGKNPENEKQKAIVQTKNNLAPICDKAIGYQIQNGEFFWTGESKLTAEKILSIARNEDERAEQNEAVAFLREALSEREREAKDVEKEADKFGITVKQLRTARSKLDVKWRREGFGKDSKVFWRLPSIDAQNTPETIIDAHEQEKGHLWLNDSDKTSSDNDLPIDARSLNNRHLWSERTSLESEKTKCWNCGELFQDVERCPKCNTHQDKDLPF
jgi:RecA-family ATPase